MTLEEAKEIFSFSSLTDETELKKKYKNLVFLFHPDAHPENPEEYMKKIQEINEAYSILENSIEFLKRDKIRTQEEEYKKQKQIKKEQILTGIVVKSYYQSQNEINKLKTEMLNQYISKAAQLNINREKVMGNVLEPITVEIAHKEARIMNVFVKQNVLAFINEYGLQINESSNRNSFLYMFEPLYFLDVIPDWYEKVLNKENLLQIAKK